MLATATSGVGFGNWSLDPPLVLCADLAVLYWLGSRRTVTPQRKRHAQRWRDTAFYGALIVLVLALSSPLDALSEQLFWAHMLQHVLVMLVAAPLLVLSRPWIRLWRSLPLAARRWLGRGLSHGRRTAPLRTLSAFVARPGASLALFSIVLLGWHLPSMFDATLSSGVMHGLEHALFFSTAVLFFKQVIPSPPLHLSLAAPQRVIYAIAAMIVSWVLAVVLALSPHALYAHYAHEASRPGGISALADQQLAAGIMWVPGSITFLIVVFVYVHRWLAPTEPGSTRSPRLASEH
ncbi:MAG: cytochrome c oxidase assembly protein [Solirubrobacterales bacterium]|nr:cytochrome c oxidase assembly protein [Solirubrobacterales bacterium]